ncbi:MAG: sensor histidine kinase [Candidatus Thiodiazotropha sp.]
MSVTKTQEIEHLYDLVNILDPIVLIDSIGNQVVWKSEKFRALYNNINIGAKIDNKSFKLTQNCHVNTKIIDSILGYKEISHHILEVNNYQYDVEVIKISESKVALRFKCVELRQLANSRYLEDREKLLFTSRSITVSEMASTLAHELKEQKLDVYRAWDKSLEQIKYTSDIITRIRDYTQSRQPKLSTIQVNSLIRKCISLMDWEIKHADIEFSYFDNTENIVVFGDEVMLQQVIVNLIRNGIDASIGSSSRRTKINILTTSSDDNIQISIKDNGKGMTQQEADNIFIPFASNKSSGMGIGLNICRSFIELHKGKLWLTQNSDSGCTSHIMLPLMS